MKDIIDRKHHSIVGISEKLIIQKEFEIPLPILKPEPIISNPIQVIDHARPIDEFLLEKERSVILKLAEAKRLAAIAEAKRLAEIKRLAELEKIKDHARPIEELGDPIKRIDIIDPILVEDPIKDHARPIEEFGDPNDRDGIDIVKASVIDINCQKLTGVFSWQIDNTIPRTKQYFSAEQIEKQAENLEAYHACVKSKSGGIFGGNEFSTNGGQTTETTVEDEIVKAAEDGYLQDIKGLKVAGYAYPYTFVGATLAGGVGGAIAAHLLGKNTLGYLIFAAAGLMAASAIAFNYFPPIKIADTPTSEIEPPIKEEIAEESESTIE